MADHFFSGVESLQNQSGELDDAAPIFVEEEEEDGEGEGEGEGHLAYLQDLGDEELRNEVHSEEKCARREIATSGEEAKQAKCARREMRALKRMSGAAPKLTAFFALYAWNRGLAMAIIISVFFHVGIYMGCLAWLKQRKNQGKCPQCNGKCALKDVRKLFASRVVAVEEEAQKRIWSLERKCASFEKKRADWSKKEAKWRNIEAELQLEVKRLRERTTYLEGLLGDLPKGSSSQRWWSVSRKICDRTKALSNIPYTSIFSPFYVTGVAAGWHLFDVDASNQILLFARSLPGMAAKHMLTKMSLVPSHGLDDICFLPRQILSRTYGFLLWGWLALFTSLGKKLSLLRWLKIFKPFFFTAPKATMSSSSMIYWLLLGLAHGISTARIICMQDCRMAQFSCLTHAKVQAQ